MKLLVVGDVHWCQNSSIIRRMGDKYSVRLENLINSVNWTERVAETNFVDLIVYLGDFFDTASLNAMEITALKEICWAKNARHIFLCGNHEMGSHDLAINSANVLSLISNCEVVSEPNWFEAEGVGLYFLPYILESERHGISEYFSEITEKSICFSHNDLLGLQMGQFLSKEGFDISDMSKSFTRIYNGHLHNGMKVTNNLINVGNLTGQNFSEDATKYRHQLYMVEINNGNFYEVDTFVNPFAFNFYKFDFTDCDINYVKNTLSGLKDNAVLSITCSDDIFLDTKAIVTELPSTIVESRIIKKMSVMNVDKTDIVELSQVDHLKEFQTYVLDTIGNNDVVLSELGKVIA